MQKINPFNIFKSRRLQFDILVIFIVLFLGTCIAIISYTYDRQSVSIVKISHELMGRAEAGVIDDIHDYLKPASIITVTSNLLEEGVLNLGARTRLSGYLESVLRSYPHMYSIYIVDNHGNYLEETRVPQKQHYYRQQMRDMPKNSRYFTLIVDHENNKPVETWIYKDSKGNILKTLQYTDNVFQPFKRPWYQGARNLVGEYWLGVYPFYFLREPGITVAFPIVDKSGKRLGVVAVDFKLPAITKFLKQHKVGKNSAIFITDKKGSLIAIPGYAHKIKINEKGQLELLNLKDLKDIRLLKAFQQFSRSGKEQFVFRANKQDFIAVFKQFSVGYGHNWLLGLVVPITDFVGPILQAKKYIFLFSLGILLLGIILIIFVSRKISRAIVKLADEADRIRDFELSEPIYLKTRVTEIQILLNALRSLKASMQSFIKYVPQNVVRKLVQTGEVAQLSSHKKNLTVMFSDINDFTRIAEEIPTEDLAKYLSSYLGDLAEVIRDNHGTVDKYIGDAIMAFWGAPITDQYHITHACIAALKCREKVKQINREWQQLGNPTFKTRFGLNAGSVIVGNMGSRDRLNYTVVGDNVNLAARLEALNKTFGTEIIISDTVYREVCERFLCRPLDEVVVRGRQQKTLIYELLADREDNALSPSEQQLKLVELTEKAYRSYQHKQYKLAFEQYQMINAEFPSDSVAKIYIKRCENLLR